MPALRKLLWIDCGAAALAGPTVLSLSAWLASLYALPHTLLVGMGIANLIYGTYSFALARRAVRPRPLILLLVAANAAWAVLCAILAARFAPSATPFGMAHLIGEGLFVGGLAALEWSRRDQLVRAS